MSLGASVAVERVGDVRNQVGESPLQGVAKPALHGSDIKGRGLQRWQAGTGRRERGDTAARIASIALHAGASLVAAMEPSLFRLRPKADGLLDASRLVSTAQAQPGLGREPSGAQGPGLQPRWPHDPLERRPPRRAAGLGPRSGP
jgi:sugar lactone lactonase YvrE